MTSPQHIVTPPANRSAANSDSRFCACGCGASLDGLRADARHASEACKKRAQRAASRDKAGTDPHPLQAVRDQAALDKHTRDLNGLIRQAIIDTIRIRGECHADDLIDLYPVGEVDRCRELATRQFASLRSGKNPLIFERERRASTVPARKRGKSGVYAFTRHRPSASTPVGSSSGPPGVGIAAARSGQEQESVGLTAAAEGTSRGRRSGEPGDLTLDAGQAAGKHEQGRISSPSSVAGIETPDPCPRSSSEEQRRSNPQVPGSNPGGGAQRQRGATRRSTNERAGCEDNPITAGIAGRPGRTETQGDKSEVPAVASEPLSLDEARRVPSAYDPWAA